MRDPIFRENLLIPISVTTLGVLRVGLQLASRGPWGADATLGLIALCLGVWALVACAREDLRCGT